MESVKRAEQLKKDLDNLRPIDAEAEKRIMQKFRLDWNYHSNNLEGNSLTYGETKALILFGITAQGKPLKDHFEITGHDEAIKWIEEVVGDKTPLTEKFIRELHTLLLKESSYKDAKTSEGEPTRRKIEVGKYKTQPNHVVTATGETFYFATPEETPAKMQELLEWFRKEKEKAKVNPILLASLFHYRFIRIHPFDDGNGRVARILMNFILMQFGYPPAIIKTEDKENYYAVLRLADADEIDPFIEYIAQNLVHSLEIMIKGAKGEDIEEPDDLDKELALLERKFEKLGSPIVMRSSEEIINVFDNSILKLVELFAEAHHKFDRFYVESELQLLCGQYVYENETFSASGEVLTKAENITNLRTLLNNVPSENNPLIILVSKHEKLNRKMLEDFSHIFSLKIKFEEYFYKIEERGLKKNVSIEKTYSEILTNDEVSQIIKKESRNHKDKIERTLMKTK